MYIGPSVDKGLNQGEVVVVRALRELGCEVRQRGAPIGVGACAAVLDERIGVEVSGGGDELFEAWVPVLRGEFGLRCGLPVRKEDGRPVAVDPSPSIEELDVVCREF